jgi:hypothetical protein
MQRFATVCILTEVVRKDVTGLTRYYYAETSTGSYISELILIFLW